uniref:Cystatin fetuin-A-type domain-containing protein n=1 Tax=Paramormyrops kingsleyae TaxID=1676925 RepID=A0A3B3SNI0_9TELE
MTTTYKYCRSRKAVYLKFRAAVGAMLTLAGLFLLAHVFLAAGVLPAERPSIPCDENGAVPASQAAFQHISAQHHHGYKYKLRKSASSQLLKKDDLACEFHLELDLEETTCHVVNPKPVEECVVRETHETKVQSNCNVTLTVVEGKPTVKKYSCSSDPASAEELQKICPDCPSLLPLHYPAGLDSIKSALKKFHEESNETSNFKLLEVGRLSTQHMLTGQSYLAEFAIVQTDCRSHVICVLGRGKAVSIPSCIHPSIHPSLTTYPVEGHREPAVCNCKQRAQTHSHKLQAI